MPAINLKAINLPEHDDLLARLKSVNDDHSFDDLHSLILKSTGRQLNGPGVVMIITSAFHDYSAELPPIANGLLQTMMLKPYLEALIDDDEVKADAFAMIDRVEDQIKQEEAQQPPTPPRKKLSDGAAAALFGQIQSLVTVFDECITDKWNVNAGYRRGGANPFYNQTINGLYLEFSYGSPQKVWTPWGEWIFSVSQLRDTDLVRFMSRLTVREHISKHNTAQGPIGPVYALLAIDGVELPEPVLPTDRRQYLEYEEAENAWKTLCDSSGEHSRYFRG